MMYELGLMEGQEKNMEGDIEMNTAGALPVLND